MQHHGLTRSMVLLVALLSALTSGCGGPDADVVLYVALDRSHSEPVVRAFEQATGLRVDAHYDIEANKSVGLRRRLQAEANNPRCDVFWNNEIVQTVLLAREGLLDSYDSPAAADIPDDLKDPQSRWTGFAARGRVLIVNTELLPDAADRPGGWTDFVDPRHTDAIGMAKPLTGTTAAHAGMLITTLGLEQTFARFEALRANKVHFGPGNAHLMRLVRTGELHFGWTDTDDYRAAEVAGFPVAMVVPDQGEGEPGMVVIPNTISLVKGARHPDAARKLIDFVLSRDTEQMLAAGESAQIPVRDDVPRPAHVLDLSQWKLAEVDWQAAGEAYATHADRLEAFFIDG